MKHKLRHGHQNTIWYGHFDTHNVKKLGNIRIRSFNITFWWPVMMNICKCWSSKKQSYEKCTYECACHFQKRNKCGTLIKERWIWVAKKEKVRVWKRNGQSYAPFYGAVREKQFAIGFIKVLTFETEFFSLIHAMSLWVRESRI